MSIRRIREVSGMSTTTTALGLLLVTFLLSVGCASSGERTDRVRSDVISYEEIRNSGATNLYDVVSRLRPQWLNVTSRSINMETEIIVFQNDMQLGGTQTLRDMGPEIAHELRYIEGKLAAAMLPGLMSGRHVAAVIVVDTRPREGGD